MSQHVAVLLLGSNIGIKENNIKLALAKLETAGCEILFTTNILESIPVEFDSSNNFCNIATSITVFISPFQLLQLVKKIELDMGRNQDSMALGKYTDRIIDIDIVTYSNITFHAKRLKIPHFKHLNERGFSKKLLIELEDLNKKRNL